jgi:hypothetical protein
LKGVKVAELTAACIDSYQRAFDGWLSRLWWEGRTWGRLVRDPWAQERIRLIAAALLRHGSLSGANISGLRRPCRAASVIYSRIFGRRYVSLAGMRQATAEPSSALCAIGSSGLVTPRTRFQLTLAHNTLVNPTNALYLVFKFAVVLWQSLDHDIRSLRQVQANGACRKQPLADLEFVLTHNSTEV